MNKQELKNRGLNWWVKAIYIVIIVALVICAFVPGNAIYRAPEGNKLGGLIVGIISTIVFFLGDSVKLFAPDKESQWKGGYWLWVVIVLGGAALAFLILAVWHSGPLGTIGNPE